MNHAPNCHRYLQGLSLEHFLGQSVPCLILYKKKIRQWSAYIQNIRTGIYPLEWISIGLEGTLFKWSINWAHCHKLLWWEGGLSVAQISDLTQARTKVKKVRKKCQLLSHNTINSSLTGLFSKESLLSDFILSETNPVWQFPRPCTDFPHYSD